MLDAAPWYMPDEATVPPGYELDCIEREIADALSALRTRERQRAFLNDMLRPFGFTVRSLPNWRGEWLS